MPTHEEEESFWSDWARLTPEQREQFLDAVDEMVDDLRARRPFRPGLRVKQFRRLPGVFEMRWANNGRGLFRYGESRLPDEQHIIWIRVGTHDIYKKQ